MRTTAIIRLLMTLGIITWVALVFADFSTHFSYSHRTDPSVPGWLPNILLNIFIISLFYYYKLKIGRGEILNFVDLLWKVFATGLVATVISLCLRLVLVLLGKTQLTTNIFFIDFIYLTNLGLMIGFLTMAFSAWKRLILYQKSKFLLRFWAFYEYGLLGLLVYDSFFPFIEKIYFTLLVVFILIGLILSANMKWVAYLNFRQKWTGLLLLLLTVFYLLYILFTNSDYISDIQSSAGYLTDFRSHLLLLSLICFVTIYSIFSFLVILFNLPTTSVFEQKLEEVVNFQRISQSIQTEQSEESVYNILLETSVSTVNADAAWLEINNSDSRLFTYTISDKEAKEIIDHLKNQKVKGILDSDIDKTKKLSKHLSSLKNSRYRSILAFPIHVKGENIGTLALLKELPEGFNKEMTKIVAAFANQAGISIENFRLLEEALQNERYKEELKIAKTVQKSLLPQILEKDPQFTISAFSESADEVGGDYYDTLRINEHNIALIIADVSGKGTTAAFHMSQMKGIFHSLAQENLKPEIFMQRSNQALAYCLGRGSFITAAFFIINTEKRTVSYSRAGHCPLLLYKAASDKMEYLKDKGIALGMVRNKEYPKYIETKTFVYAPGDIMVLYTDGITETKNSKGEEFGYHGLEKAIYQSKLLSPEEIQEKLIATLYQFLGSENLDDDYTTMIIKFS